MINRSFTFSALLAVVLIIFSLLATWFWAQSKTPTPPPLDDKSTPEEIITIEAAVRLEIDAQSDGIPLLLFYDTQIDNISISADGYWATAWLVPVDRETGNVIPTEPGLVILRNDGDTWYTMLPSDPLWAQALLAAPEDLILHENKLAWMKYSALEPEMTNEPYTGYYLPWAGGETMALTQSVGHDRYTPSGNAHYAFDFAMQGYPSGMYNVHAAKSGTVKQAVWSHENGNESLANYMVIEDTSTDPTTYQLYLHFAKDSIPPALRIVGAPVYRGQIIGVADDTGISTGNHLHFMLHTNPTSYWGRSVDITFMDVTINGGRPRITSDLPYCWDTDTCDDTQYLYISGNFISPDHTPPTGSIINPPNGITLETDNLNITGWAVDDDSGISSAQFTARYNGAWNLIGESYSTEQFGMNWDLCSDQVPDGPISLALDLWDNALNHNSSLPGLRHFTKNFQCPTPPPECVPSINQAALFADIDYQGDCVVLDIGSHTIPTDFADLGPNNAASVQLGSNARITLYKDDNLSGRGETFEVDDSNLDDNRIGANQVSSAIVNLLYVSPELPIPTWPEDGTVYKDTATFSLVWENGGGATQYQARIQPQTGSAILTEWQNDAFWHLNSLPPGNYTWQVRARNSGGESQWSSIRNLEIQADSSADPVSVSAPFTDNMESLPTSWRRSAYWDLNQIINHTPGGSISWRYDTNSNDGYDTGMPNSGYLTSPSINLPAASEYFLRFWYYYETEGPHTNWDQRWIQISVNGGEFTNILQLQDDVANNWLQSPAISLAGYAGQAIRIRFYFATLDDAYNLFKGWHIDDVSVTANPPPDCSDDNNSITDAQILLFDSSTSGIICPGGDIDYYSFQGVAGDHIGVHINAQEIGSQLDSYLYLLDSDGTSVLTENDDLVYSQRTDSWISYRIKRTATYFLKLRAWDHPSSGDAQHFYTLDLSRDQVDPVAEFVYPNKPGRIPNETIDLIVAAEDADSGVSHVQFLWHSNDWANSDWIELGIDWDASGGWSYVFDATAIPDPTGIAFYARVYDWAGNWRGVGVWDTPIPNIYLPVVISQ